jgi:PAS domain S-box-containing protein
LHSDLEQPQERVFTHWLSGRPVWFAMFALTLLFTAYTVVVMMYSGTSLVWSPAKPLVVFLAWGAIQTCFALVCLLKLRHERRQHAVAFDARHHTQLELAQQIEAAPQVRYKDYFENLTEMIAMLSAEGKYLYVNSAWQRYFGRDAEAVRTLEGFAAAFPFSIQSQAATLFERALAGEHVEQMHLRMDDSSGRMREMEASLSALREAGQPRVVRCIFRDVTLRNQRERRLAMQLGVGQVIQEASTEDSLPRILSALGSHLGFDLVELWRADASQQVLRYGSMWMAADCIFPSTLAKSATMEFTMGDGLPGQVWMQGASIWVEDIRTDPRFEAREGAKLDGLASCWAVPVRVGNQVIAVIEFFSRKRVPTDVEMMATVETVCASVGQFLGRSVQEKRVTELNRQKESILNTVADGILGTDQHGRVTFANPAAAAMLGNQPGALIGRFVHAIVHEDVYGSPTACASHCYIRRGLFAKDGAQGQDIFYRPDGSSFPVEFTLTPMQVHGSVTGSVLNFRDVSQRQALDRMKDEFISTVSHELRTPLTSIRGSLGLLSTGMLGEVNEKAANLLRIAVNNSDRLVRLINDILDLERLQSGRAPLSFRAFSLSDLAQQAIETLTPVADSAAVKLELDAEPLDFIADPDRLQQVLTNLLSNAIKFSPPDSVIKVKIAATPEGAAISVSDAGRGIPEEKLESIFDRFQQVDASDSRQKGGTGLGLAICRTIVGQHGGRIWAERNAQRGSTFHIFLPENPHQHAAALDGPLQERQTIMISASDNDTRTSLAASLRFHGYNVVEASSGRETIAHLERTPPRALLLDLTLPDMSGWEVLRILKEEPMTAETPVIMLSMHAMGKSSTLGLGADGWLQVPAQETELLEELSLVLNRQKTWTEILLVEDDLDLARVISATFERAGVHVLHAASRHAALEMCESFTPSLMILDLGLPDGDGYGLVERLRIHPELHALPMLVYSGRELSDAERDKLRLGPTHFLTKSTVQPQEVEELVLAMLRTPAQNGPTPATSGKDLRPFLIPVPHDTPHTHH